MGKVIPMLGGSGGADLDMITATAADVRAGKVIVDKEGNPVAGVEPERGNWTGNVAMNGKITIPDGHHGGGGYVNGPAVTQRGAWNGAVGMNAQVAIPEGYHNGAGKVTGPSVAYQNADVSGTDRANATNRSCWDGTICLGVRNNHYLNGVNWIQFSDPNFRASNFKKGVPIMGLIGTFEGYVPTPQDLYLRGNNLYGWYAQSGSRIDSGQITITNTTWQIRNTNSVNLTGYNNLNFCGYSDRPNNAVSIELGQFFNSQYWNTIVSLGSIHIPQGDYTISFNIQNINSSGTLIIGGKVFINNIYRIWLS